MTLEEIIEGHTSNCLKIIERPGKKKIKGEQRIRYGK